VPAPTAPEEEEQLALQTSRRGEKGVDGDEAGSNYEPSARSTSSAAELAHIADEVWPLLKRRIAMEAERHGQR